MFIDDALTMNVDRNPGDPALFDGDLVVSFAELHERMCRLHGALSGMAAVGERVGILSKNVPEYLDALYGVPAAGMVLAGLNQRLHPTEWVGIANDAGLRVVIVHEEYIDAFLGVRDLIPTLEHVVVLGDAPAGTVAYDDLLGRSQPVLPRADRSDDDIAWIVYTSGTTGAAKGVMLSHRCLIMGLLTTIVEYGPRPKDRQYFTMPLCHVGAVGVVLTHIQGGTYVTAPSFEPGRFLADIERYGITSTTLMPTMLRMLLDHPAIETTDLSTLIHVGFGGPMPVDLLRECLARFGPIMASGFGMSEAPGTTACLSKADVVRAAEREPRLLTSCGKPSMLVQVKVVDDELKECPPEAVGEIVIRSDNLFRGYLNKPEITAASFQDGWFRTGDMALRDENGFMYLVDRRKDMIKSGGESVFSVEVERVLEECPGVAEVAVIGLPDPLWIETVTAIVVTKPGVELTAESIVEFCRQRLAGYKCPRIVHFRDALPRSTAMGKILKRDLREMYAVSS